MLMIWRSKYWEVIRLRQKNRESKECNCCKSYNPECRMGACSIYPYQKQKQTEIKEIEIRDTG